MSALNGIENALLIAVEGPDGCGKTLLSRLLVQALDQASGYAFPSRTPFGDFVRSSYTATSELASSARLYLFAADAVQASSAISDKLATGRTCVLDRHPALSALAYQLDEHPTDRIVAVLGQASQALYPDLVLFVRTDAMTCLQRRQQMHCRELDRYTPTDVRRVEELYQRYFAAATLLKYNTVVVDGNQASTQLVQQCLRAIAQVAETKRKILLAATEQRS